jgi:hypothetical protein
MKKFKSEMFETKGLRVHTTNDYFLFKPIDGNRTKNQLHINRLKKSISENYLFTVIIVNERYEIIDGQHRFDVISELKLPLNYIMCEGYSLNEVHILNQNSKNWNADDYVTGFCNLGRKDYIQYRDFKDKYNFGHNECMAMLTGINVGGGLLFISFKNGLFKVTDHDEAIKQADQIMSIEPYYDGFKRRAFVYALLELFDKKQFEFSEFLQKLKLNPSALTNCNDIAQYIYLIEEIYNYRRRDKINLRF